MLRANVRFPPKADTLCAINESGTLKTWQSRVLCLWPIFHGMKSVAAMLLQKKSFTLSGHRTSVALEAEFWAVLERGALRDGISLSAYVGRIDGVRGERPLASALRLRALAASQS